MVPATFEHLPAITKRLTFQQPASLSSARETELFKLAVRQLCVGFQVQVFARRHSGEPDHE